MGSVLAASGASLDEVARVGVFLTDIRYFAAMNDVCEIFVSEPYPARTTVYVKLPEGLRVEIDVVGGSPSGT